MEIFAAKPQSHIEIGGNMAGIYIILMIIMRYEIPGAGSEAGEEGRGQMRCAAGQC